MRYVFEFIKYQGCGNDFILKDETEEVVTPDSDRSKLAKILCHRHFQVGADGILFIERAEEVDGSMRLFEPDGGEADMCGNGIRCIGSYLTEKLQKPEVDVLTRDGIKRIARVGNEYKVQMGTVRTRRRDVDRYFSDKGKDSDILLDLPVHVGDRVMRGSLVNTGEPHLVFVSDNVATVDVRGIAETINRDRTRFPRGMNVNFMEITGPHEISNRTYERGVFNETMACGTGATASAAVSLLLNLVKPGPVKVTSLGGTTTIDIDKDGNAQMTGPASAVFKGELAIEV